MTSLKTITTPLADVAAMRAEFDRSFAEAPATQAARGVRLLLIKDGAGRSYALRLDHVSAIVGDRRVVAVPSPVPGLIGVAGIRGGLVAVYALTELLGGERGTAPSRWIAVCPAVEPVGLAFAEIEGQEQVAAAAIVSAAARAESDDPIQDLAQTQGGLRPIVAIPILLDSIRRRCARVRAGKEP
jgi:purine-binding chemotaxis protein CheW